MTTTLEWGEGSASRPGRSLRPRKTQYPLYGRLGGPQGRSGQVRKILATPGLDPRTVQPVASRYTDWATRPTLVSLFLQIYTYLVFKRYFIAPTCCPARQERQLSPSRAAHLPWQCCMRNLKFTLLIWLLCSLKSVYVIWLAHIVMMQVQSTHFVVRVHNYFRVTLFGYHWQMVWKCWPATF